MKPEKIVELTEQMLNAQERYFKSGKNPQMLYEAKRLEDRVRKAITKAKDDNPMLFTPDPQEVDIPGTIGQRPQDAGTPQLVFSLPTKDVEARLRTLWNGKITPVRIIVRIEE